MYWVGEPFNIEITENATTGVWRNKGFPLWFQGCDTEAGIHARPCKDPRAIPCVGQEKFELYDTLLPFVCCVCCVQTLMCAPRDVGVHRDGQ